MLLDAKQELRMHISVIGFASVMLGASICTG
jgi:hypothetical protein